MHLQIENTFHLIPVSMIPVKIWWCSAWVFVFTTKDPVLTPPKLHQKHCNGYQIKCIINAEVREPVLGYKNTYYSEIGVHPVAEGTALWYIK